MSLVFIALPVWTDLACIHRKRELDVYAATWATRS